MMYPVIHKTISAYSQLERTLVIIGTKEQIELISLIVDSVQRGTLLQDMATLIPIRQEHPGD